MFLQRTELLIGSDNIEKLKNSNVIVFGLGGVGGATVEALVRAGIGNLSIVDFDTIDKTNLNRQIITTQSVIGKTKVEVAKDRILSINPDINLTIIRKELKKRRINKLKVVYSDETPRKPLNLDGGREKNKNVGSISFVPPVAGMLLASEVIKDICKL